MLWYRFSRIDRFLIIGSAIGLIVATGLLLDDRWIYSILSTDRGQKIKIGYASKVTNDVRRRHDSAFAWSPLDERVEVYQGDSIFTGEKSEAVIVTEKGEQIQISANSLIVINAQSDSLRLDINFGSVLGQVGKDKKLLIGSKGDVTEFKGEDAVVKVAVGSSKSLVVNVIEGQVEVSSDDGRRTLGPKENAEISEAGTVIEASDVKIETLLPTADHVLAPNEINDFSFTWKSSYPFFEYTIEIAKDPDFKNLLLKEKTNRTVFRPASLPTSERLFWRVSARLKPNQEPSMSSVSAFTLAEDAPATIEFPRDNSTFTFEEQPSENGKTLNVTAKWKTKTVVKRWDVQLAESSDFSKGLRVFETKESSVELFSLFEGRYYVKVRSKDWPNAIWSESILFSVRKKSPASLRPPQVLSAEDSFILKTKYEGLSASEISKVPFSEIGKYVEAIPELAWNTIPGAYSYEIQISSNPEFDSIVHKDLVPSTRYGWKAVQIGKFYWRTRAISANNLRGPFTEPQKLEVTLAPPSNLTNETTIEEVTELTQMESSPPPFLLRWTPTLLATEYQIEFDQDPNFRKPLRISTSYPFKKIQAPSLGKYFWKVRALATNKRALTEWSESYTYEYKRVYLSPETTKELKALYPNEETIMLIGEGELKINFRWATPIKSGRYRFQLSQTSDFTKNKLDFLTEKEFFLLREKLTDGWYFWRLRVETPQFTSPWTTAYKFQIQHEFTPFNFDQSESKIEGQLKQLALEKKVSDHVAAIERRKQEAEEARAAYLAMPKLDRPEELSAPENFFLEPRGVGAALKGLEQISQTAQQQILKEHPNLEWVSVNEALEYTVEISETIDFKKLLYTTKINRPTYRWTTPVPGKFFWRVQARAPGHQPSDWSEPAVLELNVVKPKLNTPHAIALLPATKGQFTLDWTSVPFSNQYEIEMSERSDFKDSKKKFSTQPKIIWSFNQSGDYYWRVTPLNTVNRQRHSTSEPRHLVVRKLEDNFEKVELSGLLFPKENQYIFIEGNENPYLTFMWNYPRTKGAFTLELSRDKEFLDLVSRQSTPNQLITYFAPYAEGMLYWRVTLNAAGKTIWQSGSRVIYVQRGLNPQPAAQKNVLPKRLPSGSR